MIRSGPIEILKDVLTDANGGCEPRRGTPGYGEAFVHHYFDNPRPMTCLPRRRLDHLECCVRTLVDEGIAGDLLEAGIWRGGAVALMRAVLADLDEQDRIVWGADSFEGLPDVDPVLHPKEALALASPAMVRMERLRVSVTEVRRRLSDLNLLDDRVRLLDGWFEQTLPRADIGELALLRVDCDLYESTTTVLETLYDRVVPGGFVIIDDYGEIDWTYCREAVDSFRRRRMIHEQLVSVDDVCVWWRKRSAA